MEEEEAALSQGRTLAELPPAMLWAPARGGLAPMEPFQVRRGACLPLPTRDPKPHPGPCHTV